MTLSESQPFASPPSAAPEEHADADEAMASSSAEDGDSGRAPSRSYVIPCQSSFRDAVLAAAAQRGVSAADLARSVLLMIDAAVIDAITDPGLPGREDRETVVVQSGAAKDRRLLRKPRLQIRLQPGLTYTQIRKALALALAIDRGERRVSVAEAADAAMAEAMGRVQEELQQLRDALTVMRFEPLSEGIRTRGDALFVLGFPPYSRPSFDQVKERFRQLAKVHHPDSPIGDNLRMAQLNDAVKVLRTGGL